MLAAFGVAAWLTRRFCDPRSRLHILDHPNERSLHARPTPRSGGVALLAGTLVGLGLLVLAGNGGRVLGLVACALPLALVAFADDRRGLPVWLRLAVQAVVAVAALWWIGVPGSLGLPGTALVLPALPVVVLGFLFLVWMTNLYNFMDGMDGFAGGMALIGFGSFALLGARAGDAAFVGICGVLAAAAAGFLRFNLPPARIFMGDTGSSVLGFLAGTLVWWAQHERLFPLWIGVLVFSPFIVDATVTLVRRVLNGEKVWQAHRSHFYQRLVRLGWGHRRTVLAEYVLMLAAAASALAGVGLSPRAQALLALGWLVAYVLLMLGVRLLERRAAGGVA